MVSSLTAHDFLLADMVICLELSMLMRSPPSPCPARNQAHFSRLLDALLQSQRIWTSKSVHSGEARTAALTLQLMIDKVQQNSSSSCSAIDSRETAIHTTPPSESQPRLTTETETEILSPLADAMTEMITSSEDLDWVNSPPPPSPSISLGRLITLLMVKWTDVTRPIPAKHSLFDHNEYTGAPSRR